MKISKEYVKISFTDNTNKEFICIFKGSEPKNMNRRIEIIEHWFDSK